VGLAGLDVLYARERLHGPLRRGSGGVHQPTSWDASLEEIAGRLSSLRAEAAGHRVALLTGESSSLFHDLARQFVLALGSTNIARVTAGAAVPYRLTQGLDEPPGFDFAHADLILSFGLDLYEDGPAPVHAISALVGSRSTERRCTLLHVGSRLSPTAAKAEERVAIRPGTYAALALGVAHVLVREGSYDRRFVEEHTFGFEDWTDGEGRARLGFRRLLLERYYPDRAAQVCGCEPATVVRLARRFAQASAPLAMAGGEALWSSNATWTAMAVHALNALRGVFSRPGGVALAPRIPLTPLHDLEAATAADQRSVFTAPGEGALGVDPIEALADRVLDGSHPIEVLILAGCDPVHSSPAGERFRQALERIPMVVALTPILDETAANAHFVLPTPVFLESWSDSTTPSTVAFSTLGLGRPVIEPLFDSRHSGDVLLELARRSAPDAAESFPWSAYEDYLRHRVEGLTVSGQGSIVSGSFEESWVQFLEERGWRFLEHSDPERFWEDLVREGAWWDPVRSPDDWERLFRTPSGRYEFFSRTLEERLQAAGVAAGAVPSDREDALRRGAAALGLEAVGDEACLPHYEPPRWEGRGDLELLPFRPITARGRLGALSPMVLEMFGYSVLSGWQTWVEIAPATAAALALGDGDRVAVESDRGSIEAVVSVQPGAVPGSVHVPFGLGHAVTAADREVGSNPAKVLLPVHDPIGGELCLAGTRVRLLLVRRRAHGGPAPLSGGRTA
jgi:anaerobic selenocysteine-containing dehydrogenase